MTIVARTQWSAVASIFQKWSHSSCSKECVATKGQRLPDSALCTLTVVLQDDSSVRESVEVWRVDPSRAVHEPELVVTKVCEWSAQPCAPHRSDQWRWQLSEHAAQKSTQLVAMVSSVLTLMRATWTHVASGQRWTHRTSALAWPSHAHHVDMQLAMECVCTPMAHAVVNADATRSGMRRMHIRTRRNAVREVKRWRHTDRAG
jgi:hypothetical protein